MRSMAPRYWSTISAEARGLPEERDPHDVVLLAVDAEISPDGRRHAQRASSSASVRELATGKPVSSSSSRGCDPPS